MSEMTYIQVNFIECFTETTCMTIKLQHIKFSVANFFYRNSIWLIKYKKSQIVHYSNHVILFLLMTDTVYESYDRIFNAFVNETVLTIQFQFAFYTPLTKNQA